MPPRVINGAMTGLWELEVIFWILLNSFLTLLISTCIAGFGVIRTQAVEDAFRAVDRRFFVPLVCNSKESPESLFYIV
jgi:hypothetical protein